MKAPVKGLRLHVVLLQRSVWTVSEPVITPDLERLRLVGGSKSVLQLVLVTPHTAGVELFPVKGITA